MVIAIVCAASVAHAGTMYLDGFKLVGEKPTLHAKAELQKQVNGLKPQVASCGVPTVDPRLKQQFTATLKMHIAADGSVGGVELATKLLDEETIECVAKVLRGSKWTARKKPSVVTLTLVYKRSSFAR